MRRIGLIGLALLAAPGAAYSECSDPALRLEGGTRAVIEQALGAEAIQWDAVSNPFALAAVMERLLEEGHYLAAAQLGEFAEQCVSADWPVLDYLHGQALLRTAQNLSAREGAAGEVRRLLDAAETRLMSAMNAEPNRRTADLIAEIRAARDSMTTRTFQQVMVLALDKLGDLIVLIVAFFSGTLLAGGIGPRIRYGRLCRSAEKNLDRAFSELKKEKYEEKLRGWVQGVRDQDKGADCKLGEMGYIHEFMDFSDKLEQLLAEDQIARVRALLQCLINKVQLIVVKSHSPQAQGGDDCDISYECAGQLLDCYVDSPGRSDMLMRMLDGMKKRRELPVNGT